MCLMRWSKLLLGGHWVFYRHQGEKYSCVTTCVDMYIKNLGTGINGRGHVMNSAVWSLRAQQDIGEEDISKFHFLNHGMRVKAIPHFLAKYGLTCKPITLETTRDALEQTIDLLTHLPVGSGIIYILEKHATLGIIMQNGQAYLNPGNIPLLHAPWAWLNGAHSDTWYNIAHLNGHIQKKGLFLSFTADEEFNTQHRVTSVVIIYPQSKIKIMAKSARSSLRNLHQYFDYIFK